jgi:Uma2 family endonuclease
MPAFITAISEDEIVEVPAWVIDNRSFARWVASDDAPDKGKITYLAGTVRINPEMEQAFHNEIKAAISETLRAWCRLHGIGKFYTDGMVYTNDDADFTTVPDGILITKESISQGRVMMQHGKRSTKIVGSADLAVEVVSRGSARKDLIELKKAYHQAKVKEYWIVDSRLDEPDLQIFTWSKRGYRQTWCESSLLQGKFYLEYHADEVILRM